MITLSSISRAHQHALDAANHAAMCAAAVYRAEGVVLSAGKESERDRSLANAGRWLRRAKDATAKAEAALLEAGVITTLDLAAMGAPNLPPGDNVRPLRAVGDASPDDAA